MTAKHASPPPRGCTKTVVRPRVFFQKSRAGQAMVESLIVLIILVAGFLLFFDFSYGIITRLLLHNGVARVARADAVGFNEFHRTKCYRVSMIPVSGRREAPEAARGVRGAGMELSYIRAYLTTQHASEARGTLHYERWPELKHHISRNNDLIRVKGEMSIEKQLPRRFGELLGLFSESDEQKITAEWSIEDHASFYLEK